MHVLIAPDSFGSVLTAREAADAMARGWARVRPGDRIVTAPQSDGGPGFVEVLTDFLGPSSAGRAAAVRCVEVSGPMGTPVRARLLTAGQTAYIESAQACGLHLLGGAPSPKTALESTSTGVGQLIEWASDAGARRIVVGLGGSACTDGGRGAAAVFGGPQRMRSEMECAGVDLVAATDVHSPMIGPLGAAAVFGPQKGADPRTVARLEDRLRRWSVRLGEQTGSHVASEAGAGAAGGLGGLLLAVGARVEYGGAVVGTATGRSDAIARADLVLTGEGRFDEQSLRGKAVWHIADEAKRCGTSVVVIAGRIELERPDWRAVGIADAVDVSAVAGSVRRSLARPVEYLEETARRVAGRRGSRAQS